MDPGVQAPGSGRAGQLPGREAAHPVRHIPILAKELTSLCLFPPGGGMMVRRNHTGRPRCAHARSLCWGGGGNSGKPRAGMRDGRPQASWCSTRGCDKARAGPWLALGVGRLFKGNVKVCVWAVAFRGSEVHQIITAAPTLPKHEVSC